MDPLMVECEVCHAEVDQRCRSIIWGSVGGFTHMSRKLAAREAERAMVDDLREELDRWAEQ